MKARYYTLHPISNEFFLNNSVLFLKSYKKGLSLFVDI